MFKFFFKSTLYYFIIKKYKKKITSTFFYIILILITTLIYHDFVDYMSLNGLQQEVLYTMLFKWIIYFISSYRIYLNIKSIIIGDSEDDKEYQKLINENEQYLDNAISKKLDAIYQEIKDKPTLKSKKQEIYDKNRCSEQ